MNLLGTSKNLLNPSPAIGSGHRLYALPCSSLRPCFASRSCGPFSLRQPIPPCRDLGSSWDQSFILRVTAPNLLIGEAPASPHRYAMYCKRRAGRWPDVDAVLRAASTRPWAILRAWLINLLQVRNSSRMQQAELSAGSVAGVVRRGCGLALTPLRIEAGSRREEATQRCSARRPETAMEAAFGGRDGGVSKEERIGEMAIPEVADPRALGNNP